MIDLIVVGLGGFLAGVFTTCLGIILTISWINYRDTDKFHI